MEQEFLLLIDGSSLLTTQFFGNLPREILFAKTLEEKEKYFYKIMMTSKGVYTNAVFGFIRTLFKILKEQKPTYLAVAWDLSRDTFRRELYADYKGNRSETLVPLKDQFALCQDVLKRMGVCQFMDPMYEADDFCGTIAKKFEMTVPVKILTKDNDYLQLVTERTNLWMMHTTAEKTEELFKKYRIDKKTVNVPERAFNYTPALVEKEFGISPAHVNSLKGLMGDSSDNIKGVAGIGEATAVKLIQEYGTIDNLYKAIQNLDKTKEKEIKAYWKEKLGLKRSPLNYLLKTSETELVGEKAARLSEQLATIKCDIELPNITLESMKVAINEEETKKVLEELEFRSLKIDFGNEHQKEADALEESFQEINDMMQAQKIFERAWSESAVGLQFLCDRETFVGVGIATSKETAFIRSEFFLTPELLAQWTRELLSHVSTIYVLDLKPMLFWLGMEDSNQIRDLGVGAYLLNPLVSAYPYETLAKEFCDWEIPDQMKLIGKTSIEQAFTMMPEELKKLACYEAVTALHAGTVIETKLKDTHMLELFYQIEMPLIFSLYRMERAGIMVKAEQLANYGKRLAEGISDLEKEIYELTEEQFNINSPKQLGDVLFEKMKLPYAKKTKNGYSTAADVLEKLAPNYPVVKKILEYRQLAKLKSTYADGLSNFIQADGRIHGRFNQTITATGRISSTEPNLQNIPVRMELGREIRKVFVPAEGFVFVDADYSQIELRILAHMSGDEGLIKAYRMAQDIHAITASEVFHVPLEEVTPLQRRNAKAVNFGIVYGISAFGLSEDLSITRKEALDYIQRYFETYPKVKLFLDELVEDGKEHGFVSTMFGRRRPIPELKSAQYMQRQFGERVAMNSPIQGTAADIMKIAMIRVDERLRKEKLESRVILQVHDELLVEAKKEEVEEVKQILTEEMRGAADLKVPLEIDLKTGMSWFETK